jgi:asparagine synthase (glutamine-hydrolysing)
MRSTSGRFTIVFNGEVYNFQNLRRELEGLGCRFRGHSDTDTKVLLHAFEQWGHEATLLRCEGMFAWAVWDNTERVLLLACDRFGEKPLYYRWNEGIFFFGSELKAFKAHARFKPVLNPEAIALFVQFSNVPAPHSIYQNIFKLLPGSFLKMPEALLRSRNTPPTPTCY